MIRGQKAILSPDLAKLCSVESKVFVQGGTSRKLQAKAVGTNEYDMVNHITRIDS